MSLGYRRPLYLLPFDHRHSYVTGMFKFEAPLTQPEHDRVANSKEIIYEGFKQALAGGVAKEHAGILVDEEFGARILRDATKNGYVTALSIEKSGSDEFEFEYGEAFAQHIEAFDPTFAKVLVRYNPDDDAALNRRQRTRLKRLSDYCQTAGQLFMFELLVPATKAQMDHVQANKDAYDLRIRPALMVRTLHDLQDAGIEPDIWKVEGLDCREDCELVVETARRDGRHDVSCIVLGRGADEKKVRAWLETAASVPGFIGFAVGRTTFWNAVADYEAKKATRQEAASRIAKRYNEWVNVFEQARASQKRTV
jgi:myo-inositol catabolism protein IolC